MVSLYVNEARGKTKIKPVYLVEITLTGSPTLYFSDQNILVNDVQYEDYLQNLSDVKEEVKLIDSSGLNADIILTFKNDPYESYNYLIEIDDVYPFSGASCTIKECYIDVHGLVSEIETLFVGVCDEPTNIDLIFFTCSVSNKVIDKDERYIQKLFNTTDYPNLCQSATGRQVNIVGYGSPKKIRGTEIVAGATSSLQENITLTATSFSVSDASRYPSVPFTIQIDTEHMTVTSKSSNTFTITRAVNNTTADYHYMGQTVFEVLIEYIYHFFDSPIDSFSKIYIDGQEQSTGFTAYTGRTGDAHSNWPGKAVVAFSANNYAGKQRNLSFGELTGEGQPAQKTVKPNIFPRELSGGSHVVSFPDTNYGTIAKQTYSINIYHDNTYVDYISFMISISNRSNGALLKTFTVNQTWYGSNSITVEHEGGEWGTVVAMKLLSGSNDPWIPDFMMAEVSKIVDYYPTVRGEQTNRVSIECEAEKGSHLEKTMYYSGVLGVNTITVLLNGTSGNIVNHVFWEKYQDTSQYTGVIKKQSAYATIGNDNVSAVNLFISLVNSSGTLVDQKFHIVPKNTSKQIYVEYVGDNSSWGDRVVITTVDALTIDISSVSKTIEYVPTNIEVTGSEYGSSAKIVIGDIVSADVTLVRDDVSGTYTGTANSIVTLPAYAIKHAIVEKFGFSTSEIDATSFAAAAINHAIQSFVFDFVFPFDLGQNGVRPSEFLQDLARQCRSILYWKGSKWYLDYITDSTPTAVKTISKDEIVDFFVFGKTARNEIRNSLVGKYGYNYTREKIVGAENEWRKTKNKTDSTSISLYGERKEDILLWAIENDTMADAILNFQLTMKKSQFKTIQFKVFYENFDLVQGQTFDIDNLLYNGANFFVESSSRIDQVMKEITGRSWS